MLKGPRCLNQKLTKLLAKQFTNFDSVHPVVPSDEKVSTSSNQSYVGMRTLYSDCNMAPRPLDSILWHTWKKERCREMNICNQVIRFSFSRRYLDLLHNVQSIYSTLKILAGKESICESISITLLNKMNIPYSKSDTKN